MALNDQKNIGIAADRIGKNLVVNCAESIGPSEFPL